VWFDSLRTGVLPNRDPVEVQRLCPFCMSKWPRRAGGDLPSRTMVCKGDRGCGSSAV